MRPDPRRVPHRTVAGPHLRHRALALTFWFGFRLLRAAAAPRTATPTDWLVPVFLWIVLAAVVGARAMHVLSNLSYYTQNPGDILAVWHGGLSSFGGLLLAVPVRHHPHATALPRNSPWVGPSDLVGARPPGLAGPRPPPGAPADGGGRRPTRRTNGSACTTPAKRGGGCRSRSSRPSRTSPFYVILIAHRTTP